VRCPCTHRLTRIRPLLERAHSDAGADSRAGSSASAGPSFAAARRGPARPGPHSVGAAERDPRTVSLTVKRRFAEPQEGHAELAAARPPRIGGADAARWRVPAWPQSIAASGAETVRTRGCSTPYEGRCEPIRHGVRGGDESRTDRECEERLRHVRDPVDGPRSLEGPPSVNHRRRTVRRSNPSSSVVKSFRNSRVCDGSPTSASTETTRR
jgi:hypothetical protein